MRTITFICDTCKKSVGESELYKVSTSINIPKGPNSSSGRLVSCEKDICKECLEKKGLVTFLTSDEYEKRTQATISNQKTLEAKLIDFLADLGVLFEQ